MQCPEAKYVKKKAPELFVQCMANYAGILNIIHLYNVCDSLKKPH